MRHTREQKDPTLATASAEPAGAGSRSRPRPGERRVMILQALAELLEQPKIEKITTASLAAKLGVSEAALYRHFANKAQIYEGLIEFIEQTIFTLINQIGVQEAGGVQQVRSIALMLLGFAEKNPGMTRVLTGEALVGEHQRLLERINQLFDRIEASLRQALKLAAAEAGQDTPGRPAAPDPALAANLVLSYVLGRWHRYAKSGFSRKPTEQAAQQLRMIWP